jgi:hypothetical protein
MGYPQAIQAVQIDTETNRLAVGFVYYIYGYAPSKVLLCFPYLSAALLSLCVCFDRLGGYREIFAV